MKAYFADTSYFIALLSGDDRCHEEASLYTQTYDGAIITTAWILMELTNYFSKPPNREMVVDFIAELKLDQRVTVISAEQGDFDAGLELFADRPDKEWSVVDCISFLAMEARQIRSALTKDHHFEQAGFEVLLKE